MTKKGIEESKTYKHLWYNYERKMINYVLVIGKSSSMKLHQCTVRERRLGTKEVMFPANSNTLKNKNK